MAIIAHRWSFRKGLRVQVRATRAVGRVVAVAANGLTVWLDNGHTLYLEINEARLRLRSEPCR